MRAVLQETKITCSFTCETPDPTGEQEVERVHHRTLPGPVGTNKGCVSSFDVEIQGLYSAEVPDAKG